MSRAGILAPEPPQQPPPPSIAALAAERLAGAIRSAGPPLLFGLRLWASVCLALYVAFWLQLDNVYWAGATAAIVCQPSLGASLRTRAGSVWSVRWSAPWPRWS
ncbi:MAG: FUSC family protein [Stellaceae bacterium]